MVVLNNLALKPDNIHCRRQKLRDHDFHQPGLYNGTLSLKRKTENLVQFFPHRLYLSKIIYHLCVVHYSNTTYSVGSLLMSLELKTGLVEIDVHESVFLEE